MAIRRANAIVERAGVNYVRDTVEANNCVFKEVNQQHDYGHDAFVLLVDGEQVLAKEFAVQIKSGASYCTANTCKIPATAGHLAFWAGHDLTTLGVVYDPAEATAYWTNLQAEARERTSRHKLTGALIEFSKADWNRFDGQMFKNFLMPMLRGTVPQIDFKTATNWALSDDPDTHDLGVQILAARHYREPETWITLLDLFHSRKPETLTPRVWLALSNWLGTTTITVLTKISPRI